MRYYVIGTYEDGTHSLLCVHETIKEACSSIRWQAQPRGSVWWSLDETKATVNDGYGHPDVVFTICEPTTVTGFFKPLDGSEALAISRGPYTQEAFDRICADATADCIGSALQQ